MKESTKVACPQCGCEFDVQEILSKEVEESIKADFDIRYERLREDFQVKEASLLEQKLQLEQDRESFSMKLEEEASALVKKREKEIEAKLEKKYEAERSSLIEEQEENKSVIAELRKVAVEKEKLERKFKQIEQETELKYEKLMSQKLDEELAKALKLSASESELKMRELTLKLERTTEQLAEAQRQIEQGSVQLQGEVQELAIEEWLREKFPFDEIAEIKKGARGADCVHKIRDHVGRDVGCVYYESKRTKDFQKSWIEKFKQDMRERNADVGVLVTQIMPSDMEFMSFRDGILVCTFTEFKAACFLVRERVLAVAAANASQENRGDKIGMVYDYLCGNEFRMSVEGIVDAFTEMQTELESERRTTKARWAKREKQIDKVITNTTRMYGSIRGIAGGEVQAVAALELDGQVQHDRLLAD